MASKLTDLEVLKLFNEKVTHLQGLSITKYLKSQQVGALVEFQKGKGWDSIFIGPESEQIDAFVLTMRFFIQNNETTSIGNMRERYVSLPISGSTRKHVLSIISELNEFLDGKTNISIDESGPLTNRQVMELFVWGSRAHANTKKREIHQALSETAFFPILEVDFQIIIHAFLVALDRLKEVNESIVGVVQDAV